MVPPHYFMKTLCRQLNYNLDGEYFKGCWDGGARPESNLGRYLVAGCWGDGGFNIIVNRQ